MVTIVVTITVFVSTVAAVLEFVILSQCSGGAYDHQCSIMAVSLSGLCYDMSMLLWAE